MFFINVNKAINATHPLAQNQNHLYHVSSYQLINGQMVHLQSTTVKASAISHLLTARCRKATTSWVVYSGNGLWQATTQNAVTNFINGAPHTSLPVINMGSLPQYLLLALGLPAGLSNAA